MLLFGDSRLTSFLESRNLLNQILAKSGSSLISSWTPGGASKADLWPSRVRIPVVCQWSRNRAIRKSLSWESRLSKLRYPTAKTRLKIFRKDEVNLKPELRPLKAQFGPRLSLFYLCSSAILKSLVIKSSTYSSSLVVFLVGWLSKTNLLTFLHDLGKAYASVQAIVCFPFSIVN